MPKRKIDGERIWSSDKLRLVEPSRFRGEYMWLLPLAKGGEWFRCEPHYVWARCYSYNRPDISVEIVSKIFDSFEEAGLIERENEKGRWLPLDTDIDEARKLFLVRQDGKCAICQTEEPGIKGFCVDHNHVTGKLRGALCGNCNRGIGLLQDNPEVVQRAADYLRQEFIAQETACASQSS